MAALTLALLVLAGCAASGSEEERGPFVFYMNSDTTALTKKAYRRKNGAPETAVKQMLTELSIPQSSIEIQPAIPHGVKAERFELEQGTLRLYMNEEYAKLDKVKEVLCRSAVVQTLTQIDGVNFVEFFVGGQPLKTKGGEVVGPMNEDCFVQDTGTALKSYQQTTLTLFFPNAKGDRLISEKVDVRYLSSVSPEKLVLERLMKGPQTKGLKPVLLPQTKLLSVSVKDGICYVNFDRQFLKQGYEAKPEIIIYGIVNSLISSGTISRVQISVEGETGIKFQESVSLNEPFDWNLEVVEKK